MKTPVLLAVVMVAVLLPLQASAASTALVYKNEGCGHCGPYLVELKAALAGLGITDVTEKEFVNDQAIRRELALLQESFNVPLTMQGHMVTLVDGKYLFEGHVAVDKVKEFLKNPPAEKMVVYLDSMSGQPEPYSLMTENGEVKQCSADQQVTECAENNGPGEKTGTDYSSWVFAALIVLVPAALIIKFG